MTDSITDSSPAVELENDPGNEAATEAVQPEEQRLWPKARQDDPWLSSLLRPFLITTLIACINIALIAFLDHLFADFPSLYGRALLWLGIGAGLIGCYTATLLAQPEQRQRRYWFYRVAELCILLVMGRLVIWTVTGSWPTLLDLLYHPLSSMFDMVFVFSAAVIAFSWVLASLMTKDFLEMALQPDELLAWEESGNRRGWAYDHRIQSDRGQLLQQFIGRWVLGGMLMILLTAGSRVGFGGSGFFALARQNIHPTVIGASVVYFLVGLVLITMGRLAVLRARWQLENIPSEPSIMRNWPIYALGLIGIIGLIAAVLPFGSTFRLAQIISFLIEFVYAIFYLLFSLILALFSRSSSEEALPTRPTPPPAAAPQESLARTAEMPPWIGGTLFWLLMALLLGYATYVYLSGKGVNFTWIRRLWETLRQRWLQLWGAYETWRRNAASSAIEIDEEEGSSAKGRRRGLFSWLGLGRMSPDQQVRYYYLSTLRQAEQRGLPRRPGETPFRYAPRLEAEIEEREEEHPVTELTDKFVRVYYGAKPVAEQEASYLKQIWERIKRALR